MVLVRLASICLLQDLLADAFGPHKFAVRSWVGTDMIQWIIQAAQEACVPNSLAAFNVKASNAFSSVSRDTIRTALLSNQNMPH